MNIRRNIKVAILIITGIVVLLFFLFLISKEKKVFTKEERNKIIEEIKKDLEIEESKNKKIKRKSKVFLKDKGSNDNIEFNNLEIVLEKGESTTNLEKKIDIEKNLKEEIEKLKEKEE